MEQLVLSSKAIREKLDLLIKQVEECREELKRVEKLEFDRALNGMLQHFGIKTADDINRISGILEDALEKQNEPRGRTYQHQAIHAPEISPVQVESSKEQEEAEEPEEVLKDEFHEHAAEKIDTGPEEVFVDEFIEPAVAPLVEAKSGIQVPPMNEDVPMKQDRGPLGQADPLDKAAAPQIIEQKEAPKAEEEIQPEEEELNWDIFEEDDLSSAAEQKVEDEPEEDEDEIEEAVMESKAAEPNDEEEDDPSMSDWFDEDYEKETNDESNQNEPKSEILLDMIPDGRAERQELIDRMISPEGDPDPQYGVYRKRNGVVKAEKYLVSAMLQAGIEQHGEEGYQDMIQELFPEGLSTEAEEDIRKKYDVAGAGLKNLGDILGKLEDASAKADFEEFTKFPDHIKTRAMILAEHDLRRFAV